MKANRIGIWMDHRHAFITPFTIEPMSTMTVDSSHPYSSGSEHVIHHAQQNASKDFYKTLSNIIKDYDRVLLFGPNQPKEELCNTLRADHHFDHVRIDIKPAGKMSIREQQTFVQKHFMKYA